jgi:hypothetical protein
VSASEIAQKLRHDLKYAGLTIQNLEPGRLSGWAAKAVARDLYETRRGRSCLVLAEEAHQALAGTPLEPHGALLLEAARALEDLRDPIAREEAEVSVIARAVGALRRAAEELCAAAREAE